MRQIAGRLSAPSPSWQMARIDIDSPESAGNEASKSSEGSVPLLAFVKVYYKVTRLQLP